MSISIKILSLVFFVMMLLASCGGKTDQGGMMDSDSVALDSVADTLSVVDTLRVETFNIKKKLGCWSYLSSVDYPVSGEEVLLKSIRTWILESLNYTDNEIKIKPYTGDMSDGQAIVDYYASQYMESIDYDNYIDLPEEIECTLDIKITKEFENKNVISFNVQTYWYGGGAHGGTAIYGATFRKSDGKRLGWDLVTSKKSLKPTIIDELKIYFGVSEDEELLENLMIAGPDDTNVSVADIPYPATDPWITADGLFMIYQEYEIACYAAGMPTVLIPWSKLSRYLSPQNQELFK